MSYTARARRSGNFVSSSGEPSPGFRPSEVEFNTRSTSASGQPACARTDGKRVRISAATSSALLTVRLTSQSAPTPSEASLSAAVRPAPPAPSSSTLAPRGSKPRSSRSERVMASASVLKPWERSSPMSSGLTIASGCHAPDASFASKRTVLTAPQVFADTSSSSTMSTARSLCGMVRLRPMNFIACAPAIASRNRSGCTSQAR